MTRLPFLAVCVLFFFLGSHALADQVSLKNGDRLSGTIIKSDGSTLVLHSDYAGDVSLKWDAIQGSGVWISNDGGQTTVSASTASANGGAAYGLGLDAATQRFLVGHGAKRNISLHRQ